MVWYYPYASKDEWVTAKLRDIKSFDKLISSGMYTDDDIRKYVSVAINDTENKFMELLQYAYQLNLNGHYVTTDMILRGIANITKYEDDYKYNASQGSVTLSDIQAYRIARIFRVVYGYISYNDIKTYNTFKDDYFLEYADAIIMAYTILNGTGDYFDREYVARLYKDILSSKSQDTSSPIAQFITDKTTNKTPSVTVNSDAIKVLECVVNTEKYNQLITNISEICHCDKNRVSSICDLIYAYSDTTDDDCKCLSQFEKSVMLDSFLDLYEESTPTDDVYKEIKICVDNMKSDYGCKLSTDTMDVIDVIHSKGKSVGELRRKNNIEDIDINDIVDELANRNKNIDVDNEIDNALSLIERDYEECMRNPATEANKVDYSKYDWDDEASSNSSNDKNETKTSSKKAKSVTDDDESIPDHGKAKLKGMEKGIKRSSKLNRVTSKVYKDYAAYKQQEQKIDSQVSKIVVNAAKTVTGTDENTIRRRIVGRDRFSVIGVLKRVLGTYAIFCYSKIAALCLVVVRVATGKFVTDRERRKIILELEQEIEIVDEKINDARGDENKEAKYALMRTKHSLQNAVKKIKYGKNGWNQITLGGIKAAKSAINDARGE